MSQKTRQIVFAVVLIDLGLIALAGYALGRGREPTGVLFITKGGPVAFNHELHANTGAPGMDCIDCHHKMEDAKGAGMSCRACHYYGSKPFRLETEKIHKRCIGAKCVSCHVGKECNYCHSQ